METSKKNTKTVDEFGRILIPKNIRKQFGIASGDVLTFEVDENRIVLRRPTEICIFCGSAESVSQIMSRPICSKCLEKIKEN